LALAQAEVRNGNVIDAENYYQHAEHYFRSMSSDGGTRQETLLYQGHGFAKWKIVGDQSRYFFMIVVEQ
jgi:hypothetical protein